MSSLTVGDILERRSDLLELELVRGLEGVGREIESSEISSPGLVLAGFTDRFPKGRLQVLGETDGMRQVVSANLDRRFADLVCGDRYRVLFLLEHRYVKFGILLPELQG